MEFPQNVLPWVTLFIALSTAAGLIYKWVTSDGTAAMKALDDYKIKADGALSAHKEMAAARDSKAGLDRLELERRVQHIENKMEHMPDKNDFHRIELAMAKIEGVVGRFDEKLEAVVERVNEKIDDTSDLVKKMDEYMRVNKI